MCAFYEIAAKSVRAKHVQEIHHGRLYPNLDTLVEKGLIEKSQRDRRTNEYTTTRRGTREIEARTEWEANYIDHDS
ncbi:hypothetical protein DJ84_20965 [Halorubrum ezzemoulense]|nr:hypothetical protein DJ84_20965 [Halorubrum ezzemoulense]